MARRTPGVLAGVLGAALGLAPAARAVPAPPTWAQRVAGADVIVLGEVPHWKRTSWFWQSERTYEGVLRVERVLKELADDGFDYIVCDSPAGIETGMVAPSPVARSCTSPRMSTTRLL